MTIDTERNECAIAAATDTLCPHISEPSDDCYCVNMSSTKVRLALFFCGGNYTMCEVYVRKSSGNSAARGCFGAAAA